MLLICLTALALILRRKQDRKYLLIGMTIMKLSKLQKSYSIKEEKLIRVHYADFVAQEIEIFF